MVCEVCTGSLEDFKCNIWGWSKGVKLVSRSLQMVFFSKWLFLNLWNPTERCNCTQCDIIRFVLFIVLPGNGCRPRQKVVFSCAKVIFRFLEESILYERKPVSKSDSKASGNSLSGQYGIQPWLQEEPFYGLNCLVLHVDNEDRLQGNHYKSTTIDSTSSPGYNKTTSCQVMKCISLNGRHLY